MTEKPKTFTGEQLSCVLQVSAVEPPRQNTQFMQMRLPIIFIACLKCWTCDASTPKHRLTTWELWQV